MKILNVIVTDIVKIEDTGNIGSGNVNTVKCVFSLPESFNGLVHIASFKKDDMVYNKAIVNNECYVPHEVLDKTGYVYFGVYAYEQTEEGLVLRHSPLIAGFTVDKGSYMGEGEESLKIEPSDFEMYIAAMNKIKEEVQDDVNKIKEYDLNIDTRIKEYNDNAEEKKEEINEIAEGVRDLAQAIQFATFEVTDDMELAINTADKLANVSFSLNEENRNDGG